MSLQNVDLKQSHFAVELKNFENVTKILQKKSFVNNLALLFSSREKVVYSFKSRLFLIENLDRIPIPEPTAAPATEPDVATEPATALKVATEPTKATKAAKAAKANAKRK